MKKVSNNLNIETKGNINKLIEEEYSKALENESFKKLVSKLKLDDKTLMKYTSTLEECANNYETCLNCKGILNCPYKLVGYSYLPKVVDKKLIFNYQPCNYKKKLDKSTKYLDNIYLFDIPRDIKEASINKIYKKDANRFKVIEWLYKFMADYKKDKHIKGLYLYGNFGCGKTYLIASIFNELAKEDIKSAIIFWPEYLRDLKASFQDNFKEKYEYIKTIPLLLIDDIGAESTTPWGRDEILCPLLQYRMEEKLPTFFTSNLDLKALENHFANSKDSVEVVKSRRIIERIKQLTDEEEMISKNLRN